MTNDALNDEITSINSIYTEDTLSPLTEDGSIYSLRLPSLPSISLRIEFPADYPSAPPSILGTQTVGDDVQKGMGTKIVDVVRDVLARIYNPGEACIFDLLEEVREAVEKSEDLLHPHIQDPAYDPQDPHHPDQPHPSNHDNEPEVNEITSMPPPPWTLSPPISEKKSLFLARSARVTSPSQAKLYLRHLLSTDKKAAKATHNITAWRIRGAHEATYQDCDDDGETAAGGRVLHLMQLMDVWDVMVVVTRWYGGVQLGPDRFRIINNAARECLVLGGFGKEEGKRGKR